MNKLHNSTLRPFLLLLLTLLINTTYFNNNVFAQPYNSLLWEISGKNLKKSSYLYGTMHSNDDLVYLQAAQAIKKLDDCEAVAVEITTDSLNIFGMLTTLFMKDTTLQDLYQPDDYQKVQKYIQKNIGLLGLMINLDRCKPIFIATLAADFQALSNKETNTRRPIIDEYFQILGHQKSKQVIGIETVKEQLLALDRIPLSEQAAMLLEEIENPPSANEDLMAKDMLALYARQDLDGLVKLYEGEQEMLPSTFHESIIIQRNYRMADRIDSLIQIQSTLAAVGALHLPEKEGVISLLKERGYTVFPVYK